MVPLRLRPQRARQMHGVRAPPTNIYVRAYVPYRPTSAVASYMSGTASRYRPHAFQLIRYDGQHALN